MKRLNLLENIEKNCKVDILLCYSKNIKVIYKKCRKSPSPIDLIRQNNSEKCALIESHKGTLVIKFCTVGGKKQC